MDTLINSVMTRAVLTVPMGTSLLEANQIMEEKRIRHLPIVDENEAIVGVLSQRDLVMAPDSAIIPVELMMNTPVESVDEDASIRQAIFRMLEHKISCLLITSEDETVVGIVTTDDLLWCLAHLLEDEVTTSAPLFSLKEKQTIGIIAQQLSTMGI